MKWGTFLGTPGLPSSAFTEVPALWGWGALPKSKRGCTVSHRLGKGWGAGARERCGTYICRLDCGRSCGPALSSVSTRSPFSLQHLLTSGRMGSAAPPFRNAHLHLFLLVWGPSVFLSGLPLGGDFTCSLLWRTCGAGRSLMVFFGMVRVWPEVAGCTACPRWGGGGRHQELRDDVGIRRILLL